MHLMACSCAVLFAPCLHAECPALCWRGVSLCGLAHIRQVALAALVACQLLPYLRMCCCSQDVARNHKKLLQQHRHVRYMWFPYTDAVIVVTNDPVKEVRLDVHPPVCRTSVNFESYAHLPGEGLKEMCRVANLQLTVVVPAIAAP